jgi:hypothetical protein
MDPPLLDSANDAFGDGEKWELVAANFGMLSELLPLFSEENGSRRPCTSLLVLDLQRAPKIHRRALSLYARIFGL